MPNYICFDCKEKLVQFHVFKKNIKGYSDFTAHVKVCDVLLKMEPLLSDCEQLEDLEFKKYNMNVVVLALPDFHEKFEAFETANSEPALNSSLPKQEALDTEPIVLVQTMSEGGPRDEQLHLEPEDTLTIGSAFNHDSIDQKMQIVVPVIEAKITNTKKKRISLPPASRDLNTSDKPQRKRQKVQHTPPPGTPESEKNAKRSSLSSESRRWNTNESLTPEQKNWISKQATIGTTHDGEVTHWKCTQCSKEFCSAWVLRKHLRDVHVINPLKIEKTEFIGPD